MRKLLQNEVLQQEGNDQQQNKQRDTDFQQVAELGTANQHHGQRDKADQQGTGQMRLENQNHRYGAIKNDVTPGSFDHSTHFIFVSIHQMSKEQNNREFCDLRWLEAERSQLDPALCTLLRREEIAGCHQNQRNAVSQPAEVAQEAVVDQRCRQHRSNTDHRKEQLTKNIVVTVAQIIQGRCITGRKQCDQTDAQQSQYQNEKWGIKVTQHNDRFMECFDRISDSSTFTVLRNTALCLRFACQNTLPFC